MAAGDQRHATTSGSTASRRGCSRSTPACSCSARSRSRARPPTGCASTARWCCSPRRPPPACSCRSTCCSSTCSGKGCSFRSTSCSATGAASKRGPATLKFIVYTVAGSLLMLVAIIYLYVQSPSGSLRPREHPRAADQLGQRVRHPDHPPHDVHAQGTGVHLLRARVRDQDPDRPVAHLAARPLRGMPTGGAGLLRRASSASSARTGSSASR